MAQSDRTSRKEERTSRDVERSSQQQPLARRRGSDLSGFSPGEFLSNPFALMRRMHDEMDRVFAGAFGQQAGLSSMGGLGTWMPPVEVSECDNQLCVCAELPGLKPEDVKVEITDDALIIQGERKHERDENDRGTWRSERHYGSFHRTIPLPEGAKTEEARADFKNGELRITVPVEQPQNKRRQIPISGAGEPHKK
jgi:HSP20 family protein